ncbi:TonB-dependent Receptor Plug Domain [Tangfeifania diversioriginum]|uniref:TonB-dependent Receptor Plug Domain n=1 Tax=Tangfeifania diversioriginum TaxID=1168035 RepID=A0A1M6JRU7_9BACT|nr:TonB-dependent receptor [Tangfeifania diversioriginum]SHJ49428.1 TonB-dependent Receptor Plug Domain [Tangfeifania diversioriginum]
MYYRLIQKAKLFSIRVFVCSIFTIVFILGTTRTANAQNQGEILIDGTFRDQPMSVFLDSLGTKYNLRFFYKQEWLAPHTISKEFRSTPLIQALNNIFLDNELTFRFFQDKGVVIYPEVSGNFSRLDESSQFLIIGNPLNLGRYKRATLRGRVVDGKTGETLVGAIVYHTETQKGATTDESGEFEMELPTGDHRLQFSFVGLQSSNWKIRLIEDGYEEFQLFEESHAIEEVTVVGKEADLPRSQMSMVQMSSVEIKKLPALMGEVDILKGMTMLPGVQTVGELSSGFNVRGGNTDQNLILINGSPVFNSSHLFGFLSLINPDVVENVRLFKGGMPANFGERVASVMEVGFKDGNTEQIRFYGGIGLINSRVTMDGPLSKNKKLTFVAGGRSSYTNWIMKEIPELDFARSVTQFYDVSGKITYKFDKYNRMSLMGYVSNDEFNTSTESVTQYGNILANLEVSNQLTGKLYGDFELAHSQYSYRLTDFARQNPLESYFLDNRLMYSSAGYTVRWHPNIMHKAIGGIKVVDYRINPGKISPVEDTTRIVSRELPAENALEAAVFVGDEFEISPQFSVSAGLRFSFFKNRGSAENPENNESDGFTTLDPSPDIPEKEIREKHYTGFEPRLSARYDVNANTTVKWNYQRVRQYMFQLSNNAVVSPAETWKPASPGLKPLISDQVAFGMEKDSWLRGIDFSSEVYFKYLQNLVEYKNGAQLIMNENIEDDLISASGYSAGIELSARKNTGRLTGSVSYVLSRTMQKTNAENAEDNFWDGKYYSSLYDKPHDFSLVGTYNISRRWRFSANFVFVSGRPVTLPEIKYKYAGETMVYYSDRNKYRMPPYHRLDISITFDENLRRKRMWKGSWTLSVYNAYGRENPYSVYYRKSGPGAGNDSRKYSLYKLSVIGIPVPSLTYNFKF